MVTSPLTFHPDKFRKYISIFIDTMKAIARNLGGEEVLNALIDTVIFSFPITSEPSSDKTPFTNVLKCGLAMQAAHNDEPKIL